MMHLIIFSSLTPALPLPRLLPNKSTSCYHPKITFIYRHLPMYTCLRESMRTVRVQAPDEQSLAALYFLELDFWSIVSHRMQVL